MRYSRQELVIGKQAQTKLQKSTAVIIGLGALGSVAAELLARTGVNLIIIDRDRIEQSNLQRQLLYTEKDIGQPKATAAHTALSKINSTISIVSHITDVNHRNIHKLCQKADIILDCTDNLYTRYLIDEYAEKKKKPWVYAGAIQTKGTVMVITPTTPRFIDIISKSEEGDTCDTVGVLNTISTLIASLQVNEVIKVLIGTFTNQEFIHVNLQSLSWINASTKKRGSPRKKFPYLDGDHEPNIIQHVCENLYQFYKEDIDLRSLSTTLKNVGKVKSSSSYLFFENISAFSNGRVFVKAPNLSEAKATLTKYIGMK